jgi:PAS domain S-box-containing protein
MSGLPLTNYPGGLRLGRDELVGLYEAMLSSIADFAYIFDLEGRFLYANPSLLALWGKTLDEAAGKNFFELDYPAELAARLQRQIQAVIDTGKSVKDETLYTDVNGHEEFYEYLFSPVVSEGRIIAVSGTTRLITERKQREAELIELTSQKDAQARLFDATLASINDLAYTFDLEGNWTYANKPLLELWGRSLDQIVGKSSLQLDYPPELAERLKQQVKQVVATKKPFKGETFFTSGAGVVDYHEYIFSPVFAPDGSVAAVCGTTRLITERKKAEEQLRQRSERMQLLSETLSQLLSARDSETVVRELFPRVAAHLGVDTYFNFMVDESGAALRLHSCAGIDSETADKMNRLEFGQAICGTVAQTRQPIVANDIQNSDYDKATLVRGLGIQTYACNPLLVGGHLLGTLSFASRTRPAFDGDELKFIEIISQHTAIALDRMQKTAALRRSTAQISAIINRSPVGVYLVDAQLRLQHVNPRAEPVFRNIKDLIGSNLENVLHVLWSDEVARNLINRFRHTLETGESYFQSGFGEQRSDSQSEEFYDWEIHRITLPDGQFGVVCYFMDVSAHVLAQLKIQESAQQLRESHEKLESRVIERTAKLQETVAELEAFSYSISHDLRAPLRAMQGFALILQEDCGKRVGELGKDYIRRIIRSAERMDKLIQDILVFSKVARSDLDLTPLDLNSLLRGILESYPQFDSAIVDIDVAESLPMVLANDAALTQCLSNLMGNAIKFVAPEIKPRIKIHANKNGNSVRVFVRDNGIGIARESHERIFGVFEQLDAKVEGTGIGLAIVKKATERMGGGVGLESEPGKGSTFWIDLKSVSCER